MNIPFSRLIGLVWILQRAVIAFIPDKIASEAMRNVS
jgi:hypothetical protein